MERIEKYTREGAIKSCLYCAGKLIRSKMLHGEREKKFFIVTINYCLKGYNYSDGARCDKDCHGYIEGY